MIQFDLEAFLSRVRDLARDSKPLSDDDTKIFLSLDQWQRREVLLNYAVCAGITN